MAGLATAVFGHNDSRGKGAVLFTNLLLLQAKDGWNILAEPQQLGDDGVPTAAESEGALPAGVILP